MKAAESYPIFSVQYSLLMKQLFNVAGSKVPSMTSNIVYMILSRSFVNINQLQCSWTFFFFKLGFYRKLKKKKEKRKVKLYVG